MKVNSELVKQLRGEKHWSQEQLAAACGLNMRTIQRIENQGVGSLDSVKALASVFNTNVNALGTVEAVDKIKLFRYAGFASVMVVVCILTAVSRYDHLARILWFVGAAGFSVAAAIAYNKVRNRIQGIKNA